MPAPVGSDTPLRVALLELRTRLLARVHLAERSAMAHYGEPGAENLRATADGMRAMLDEFDRAVHELAPPPDQETP